jgi:FixJ family two-component response regulator
MNASGSCMFAHLEGRNSAVCASAQGKKNAVMSQNLGLRIRIGLVDDDPSIRRALGRLIRSHGYHCIPYESAESALADPEFLKVDCLIIDVEFLGMNGFQLRDRLQELGTPIPHIFLTGHKECDFPDWADRIRDSSFLFKPVEEEELLSSIDHLLRGAGLPRQ